jgi:hypothetical protein
MGDVGAIIRIGITWQIELVSMLLGIRFINLPTAQTPGTSVLMLPALTFIFSP